jgi:uncharacterized protein (TIGR00369 family)
MSAEETLKIWNAQLLSVQQAIQRAGGKAGIATPDQVLGKTGLQVLQAWLEGSFPSPYISDTMDFHLVEVGDGLAIFQGAPQLKHYNPIGTVHGGWYATLLDSALGCAVHSTLPAGRGYTTAEVGINIVRAANQNTGPLRAVGEVIHRGKQLATAQAKIVGPDGKLYAHATTTCLVFEAR